MIDSRVLRDNIAAGRFGTSRIATPAALMPEAHYIDYLVDRINSTEPDEICREMLRLLDTAVRVIAVDHAKCPYATCLSCHYLGNAISALAVIATINQAPATPPAGER